MLALKILLMILKNRSFLSLNLLEYYFLVPFVLHLFTILTPFFLFIPNLGNLGLLDLKAESSVLDKNSETPSM